jgi:hypothetical protein
LLENVLVEGVHGCLAVVGFIKVNRGGVEKQVIRNSQSI